MEKDWRAEMRMRDRDVEMSIAQAEEEETREGSEECVLIFCKQCSDSPPLPRQTHGRFPIQSQKLERSILSGFIWIVTFQGVHQWSLIQVNKWDRFMLQTHTHTPTFNRLSSSFSSHHPQFALSVSRTYKPLTA